MILGLMISKSGSSFSLRGLGRTLSCKDSTSLSHFATVMYCHDFHPPILAIRRMINSAMTVCRLNATIHAMNKKLCTLMSADKPSSAYCLLLGCK